MASPHVAGLAALVYDRLGAERNLDNANQVVDAIINTAEDLGTPGYDPVFGYGRIDALAAVTSVEAVPDPTPTDEPAATSQLVFTSESDTSGQFSDEATFESRLTDEASGAPIEGAEVVFELMGAGGSWTATTDNDGVASVTVPLEAAPGSYFLTTRYAGDGETRLGDAEETSFVVNKEDSAITLQLSPKSKTSKDSMKATLTDVDGPALAGHPVEFFVDGVSLGTVLTDARGVAVMEVPPKYRGGRHQYETTFAGDDYYEASSARQNT